MKPRVLVLVALAVAAAIALLVWLVHSDRRARPVAAAGPAAAPRPSTDRTPSSSAPADPAPSLDVADAGLDPDLRVIPGGAELAAQGSPGGVTLRDHRGEVPTGAPHLRPGKVYVVQAPIIIKVRKTMRPLVARCSEDYAGDMLGDSAGVQSRLFVTVRAGVLTVLDTTIKVRGFKDGSGIEECLHRAFEAIAVRADGHPDVERYPLSFPFRLPLR